MPRARNAIVGVAGRVERLQPVGHHLGQRRTPMCPTSSANATRSRRRCPSDATGRGSPACAPSPASRTARRAPRTRPCPRPPGSTDRARSRAGSAAARRPRARRPGEGCSAACRAAGRGTSSRCCSASSMRRTSGTPISSAMASRVRSSWVGPSPPHTNTESLRSRRSRSASTIRVWLSPITRCS